MNRIEKLIEEMCPEGVTHLPISSIGVIYPGLSGKTKDDFGKEGRPFVNYVDVANNESLPILHERLVKIREGENQNNLRKGDILFTASSEDRGGVGLCSEVEFFPEENLYLNSFCFGLRPEEGIFATGFAKHLLRAPFIKKKIESSSNGVTRMNLSKKLFGRVEVPVPPLEIQKEIVNILDKFTQLEAELEAELEAREKQYQEVRRRLLDFESDTPNHLIGEMIREMSPEGVSKIPISKIGNLRRGKRFVKADMVSQGIPCIHYGEIYTKYGLEASETISFLEHEVAKNLRMAKPGELLIASAGETVEDIGKPVVWSGDESVVFHDAVYALDTDMNAKYVAHFLRTDDFKSQAAKYISSSKVSAISTQNLGKVFLPVPPLEIQKEIVRILDNLDSLVNSVNEGIPAEIAARRKQYEYYRDKLLTFKELDAA